MLLVSVHAPTDLLRCMMRNDSFELVVEFHGLLLVLLDHVLYLLGTKISLAIPSRNLGVVSINALPLLSRGVDREVVKVDQLLLEATLRLAMGPRVHFQLECLIKQLEDLLFLFFGYRTDLGSLLGQLEAVGHHVQLHKVL